MSDAGAPAVELLGVSKSYRGGATGFVPALSEISLAIRRGEFVSIEGPSGCGKTTLLNLLGLLDRPTAGEIRWSGTPIASSSEPARARLRLTGVGFIFQRFYLLPTLTAEENVELPMRALGRPARERKERARSLLDEVGLSERRGSFPHELSGGEEQRVAIARALANKPQMLLADEPTGELDSTNAALVLDLLVASQARAGASLVLVTHNPAVAARARRHIVLKDGRILSDSSGN